jgi:hypothetical protein
MSTPTPLPFRMVTLLISIVAAGSSLPWIFMSIGKFGGFAWGLFGFELMVLLGAVMTMLVALGRVKVDGAYPLALLCFIGTLLVASVFGIHVDARNVVGSNHPGIQPWVNRTLMLHLVMIGALSVIAALDVYRRDARSWGMLLRSLPFVIPVLAAGVYFQRSGFPAITDANGEMSIVRMLSFIVGGLILGILLSVGGHFVIRSFEVALPEKNDAESA